MPQSTISSHHRLKILKIKLKSMLDGFKNLLKTIFTRFKSLTLAYKVLYLFSIALIAIILLIMITSSLSHFRHSINSEEGLNDHTINRPLPVTDNVSSDLTDLQAKLANIESMLSAKKSVVDVDRIKESIGELNEEILQIEDENKSQYGALHAEITNLFSQVITYQKQTTDKLNEIANANNKKICIAASNLPFVVQSIDMINGRNVVSVSYADMTSPLESSFSLAGWKLVESDYEHQTARFVNHTDQCVEINLKGEF